VEVTISGKIRGSRSACAKFIDGYIKKCGEPSTRFVRKGFATVQLKPGVLGIYVRIMPPGTVLPDKVDVIKPTVEETPIDTLNESEEESVEDVSEETVEKEETISDKIEEEKEESAESIEDIEEIEEIQEKTEEADEKTQKTDEEPEKTEEKPQKKTFKTAEFVKPVNYTKS